jgi:hypothetical protein
MRIQSGLFKAVAALALITGLATCGGGGGKDTPAPSVPSATGTTTFLGMAFGQVLEEQAGSPQLRLTPGKPASVRASIVGSAAGIASPAVTLTASNGSTALGTLTMSGPHTLPTAVSASNASETFNAVLPGAWVRPGLAVQISYVPAGSEQPFSITEQPAVGNSTSLNLVLVPIQIGDSTGNIPSAPFTVRDLLAMSFPYPHANINVDTRTALTISGLTELLTGSDVGRVLAELETARALENPDAVYYGFVADAVMKARMASGRRLIGVAHTNDPGAPIHTWQLSALGTDSMLSLGIQDSFGLPWTWWARIFIHELGHVHGRHHAPCGDAGGADPNFPHANGALGAQPIYSSFYRDATFGSIGAPTILGTHTSMKDVMGYCEGVWFSDYNYYAVQRFAERYSGGATYAASSIQGERSSLVLSGEIDSRGVTLRPAFLSARTIGVANSPASEYDNLIRSVDGNESTQPIAPYVSAEIPDSLSFRVSLPAASRIAHVQVRKSGTPISPGWISEASDNGTVSWERDSAGLWVRWDSSVAPYLSVIRVTKQGTRMVLRLFAGGGEIHVPAEEFAGAGIELQLGTKLNARMLQAIAP